MLNVLLVGLGGFFGCILRYLIGKAAEVFMPTFPLGTLIVNGVASFLAGMLLAFATLGGLEKQVMLFSSVGFCGGLSTFSAFSVETLALLQKNDIAAAGCNAGLNLCVSLACVALGYYLVSMLLPAAQQG